MKIYYEDIGEFKPWSGAVETFDRIEEEGKLEEFESFLEELYPDGISEGTLNDLLWYDDEQVFEWLGIDIEDEEEEEDEEEDEEEEEEED